MTAVWLLALASHATEPGQSSVAIEADGFTITIDVDEFADRFPMENVSAASRLLVEHTVNSTWLSVDGERCLVGKGVVEPTEDGEGLRISAPILCDEGEHWRYFPSWIRGRDPSHQHSVVAFGEPVGTFGVDETQIDLDGHKPAPPVVKPAMVAASVGALGLVLAGLALALALLAWRLRR